MTTIQLVSVVLCTLQMTAIVCALCWPRRTRRGKRIRRSTNTARVISSDRKFD
ncbi:MAG: hypothetical protein HOQ24_05190 [Mycobacteriaceae bacterium]|nr:hypothetical protein [Mycobacteriaceae bacterium]